MADALRPAPVSRNIRLLSMLLDHTLLCLVCVPLLFWLPGVPRGGFYVALVLYLNKDFLQGRSPAKRLLGLQIQTTSGIPITALRALLRNVPALVWPVEVLVLVVSQQRIGDYLTSTQVVTSSAGRPGRAWYHDLIGYRPTAATYYTLLATLLSLLLLHGIFSWLDR